jgi:hypothetical protein
MIVHLVQRVRSRGDIISKAAGSAQCGKFCRVTFAEWRSHWRKPAVTLVHFSIIRAMFPSILGNE